MSDLQVGLIALGAFIIAAVVIYNWLQERNLRNEVAGDFIVPQKDVLADDFHIDADAYLIDKDMAEVVEKIKQFEHAAPAKNISNATNSNANAGDLTQEYIQPESAELQDSKPIQTNEPNAELGTSELGTSELTPRELAKIELEEEIKRELAAELQPESIVQAALYDQTRRTPVSLPDTTHPQTDLTAILYLTKNIGSHELAALMNAIQGISLPVSLNGLDNQDKWHLVSDAANVEFKQVACSLQLADRGGPVLRNTLNKFQFAVEDAGLTLNAHVEWQGSGDAMQRAIELDQFCIEVDQLISVHVVEANTPIHGTKFKGLAEASGMLLNSDGKFHYDVNETLLFTATDINNVPFTAESLRSNVLKGITFQVEIPKVNNCEQVFNQMMIISQKAASSLNAHLVDDNQRQIGDIQTEKIRQQLKVIHATMVARGIMPGSPASMRLFN